jgi:hypothetical protein
MSRFIKSLQKFTPGELTMKKGHMMKKLFLALICITVVVIPFSCKTRSTIREQVLQRPEKQLENYDYDFGSNLIERVKEPPDFILAYLNRMDNTDKYSSYIPTESEMKIIEKCLTLLPKLHKQILQDRLISIYFIDNYLGSGLTDIVLGENDELYTFLVFNSYVLKTSLTELISYKENTCFIQNEPAIQVEIKLSEELPGLFYIMLHESTHVVDYIEQFTPYVEPFILELQGPSQRDTLFTNQIWKDYSTLDESVLFPYKDDISFYGFGNGPKINVTDAVDVYQALEVSPFVSLFSSYNWAEDFAEYITFYYLTQNLNVDYTILVKENGEIIYSYRPMESRHIIARSTLLDHTLLSSIY